MSGDLTIMSNHMRVKSLMFLILLSVIFSCRDKPLKSNSDTRPGKNEMADLNRYFIQKDRERIINYIERKGLKMNETPTGLWFQIIKEGTGKTFVENDKVIMNYECSLLDGTKCYSSKNLGPREAILGKSNIEAGLNEGLRMLKPEAEAIFILPPFLAYGLIGDRKMIPSRAVVVYYVNILRSK
jgi:FKBP-type peptidyl-prolyl cis-trans isomerase FkpA